MRRGNTVPSLLLWTVAICGVLAAQTPDPGTAQVSGSLRNSITGLPIVKANIRLFPLSGHVGYIRTTGQSGEFSFEGIKPGDYRIAVERRGFMDHPAGLATLHLGAGQKVTSLDLLAMPLAAISGVVTETNGDPVPGAIVAILAQRWSMTGRWFEQLDSEQSNERGEFRVSGLAPGRYYLYAQEGQEGPLRTIIRDASGNGERRLAGIYYPNASAIENASSVELRPGQELGGIAMRMAWVPCFHVRGQLATSATEVQVMRRNNDRSLAWDAEDSERRRDGTFDIAGVTPGEYFLRGLGAHGPLGPARRILVESRDLSGLTLAGEDLEFRAQVRMETAGAPLPPGLSLRLEPLNGTENSRYHTIIVPPDGAIRVSFVAPERYTLSLSSAEGTAYVKAAGVGQQELHSPVLDFRDAAPPLEIVLATGARTIQGVVQLPDAPSGGAPRPLPERIRAVLVPQDPHPGISPALFSDADQNGGFTFAGVPPGKYFAFAAVNPEEGLWMNREFLGQVQASAATLEVQEKDATPLKVPLLASDVVQRAVESMR